MEALYADKECLLWDGVWQEDKISEYKAKLQRIKLAKNILAQEHEEKLVKQERRRALDVAAAKALGEATSKDTDELTSELVACSLFPTKKNKVQTKSTACS